MLVTAHDDDTMRRDAQIERFDAVLVKPITASALHDTLLRVLGSESVLAHDDRAQDAAERALRDRHSGARVLLVEDNPVNQEVGLALLQLVGLEVDLADDGAQAVELALRQPYGAASDPIDGFAFEEQGPGAPEHATLAWAPGSLAVALRVGQAFSAGGWDDVPGAAGDVTELPAFVYSEDGEKHLQPCAEAHVGERAGEAMLARGLIPLLSHRQRAALRVLRLQSIAEPAQPLAFGG